MSADLSSGNAPRRILIRGVNWLGDAVMSTPALQRLRERLPEACITMLTPLKLAELWAHHPSINDVLTFAAGETPWSIARRLRAQHFDTALVLPNSLRSALEVWLAAIPRRIGYPRPWRNWLLTQWVSPRPGRIRMHKRSVGEIKRLVRGNGGADRTQGRARLGASAHQVYEYLHLTAALGANAEPLPPLLPSDARETEAARFTFGLTDAVLKGRPLLAVNPGAAYGPAKRWPAQSFVAAVREIQTRKPCACIILGDSADALTAKAVAAQLTAAQVKTFNLAGQTSLREMMSLLSLCRVLLTNDSGPMHVAAALGVPVVVPFGSTSPELTGPGLPGDARHHLLRGEAPCAPCFRRTCPIDFRCMTGISVQRVTGAVLQAGGDW
jgi:heptosyltransferase-2